MCVGFFCTHHQQTCLTIEREIFHMNIYDKCATLVRFHRALYSNGLLIKWLALFDFDETNKMHAGADLRARCVRSLCALRRGTNGNWKYVLCTQCTFALCASDSILFAHVKIMKLWKGLRHHLFSCTTVMFTSIGSKMIFF